MVIGRKTKTIAGPPKLSMYAPALVAGRHRGDRAAAPSADRSQGHPSAPRSPEADDPAGPVLLVVFGSLAPLGPSGFDVGPLIARGASRKAALGHPVKERVTQATAPGVSLVAAVGHDPADPARRVLGLRTPEWTADVHLCICEAHPVR